MVSYLNQKYRKIRETMLPFVDKDRLSINTIFARVKWSMRCVLLILIWWFRHFLWTCISSFDRINSSKFLLIIADCYQCTWIFTWELVLIRRFGELLLRREEGLLTASEKRMSSTNADNSQIPLVIFVLLIADSYIKWFVLSHIICR